jgi:hypothetical protein
MSPEQFQLALSYATTVTLPLLLLLFSAAVHTSVHHKPVGEYLHEVPPRLALASIGLLLTAALSPNSFFRIQTGTNSQAALVACIIVFFTAYVLCEHFYAAAKAGGGARLPTFFGGTLSYGLAMLATRFAQS